MTATYTFDVFSSLDGFAADGGHKVMRVVLSLGGNVPRRVPEPNR